MSRPALVLSTLAATQALVVSPRASPIRMYHGDEVPPQPFFAVYHTFPKGKAEEWWGGIADVDFGAMAQQQHKDGIFNHAFMPAAVEGPILCIWETKDDDMSLADFQSFIDGPTSPAKDLRNKAYKVMPGAFTPARAWPTMPKAAARSSGSFFWVEHAFNEGMCAPFYAAMDDFDGEATMKKNHELGVHNHFFMPTGPAESDPVFCVWETKAPMSVDDFQAFIDGPDGPAPGVFVNTVHPCMEGGATPSAAFPVSWLDETMAKIETLLDDFKIEPAIESFNKKIEELTKKMSPK